MIHHVAKIGADGVLNERQLEMLEPAAHLDCRRYRAAQLEELAAQLIDPLDVAPADPLLEHPVLEFRHFALQCFNDRHVVVDHEVEDGVEDVILPVTQQPRTGLTTGTHWRIGRRGPVAVEITKPWPAKMWVSPNAT